MYLVCSPGKHGICFHMFIIVFFLLAKLYNFSTKALFTESLLSSEPHPHLQELFTARPQGHLLCVCTSRDWVKDKMEPSSDVQDFCSPVPLPTNSSSLKTQLPIGFHSPTSHCILFGFMCSVTVWKIGLSLLFLSFKDYSIRICYPILGTTCFIQHLSSVRIS